MFVTLRTTVFWNLCLLMVLSAMLISLVVYRIMEREILRESALSGRAVVTAVATGASRILKHEPPPADSAAQLLALFKSHIDSGICDSIVLVGPDARIIAQWPDQYKKKLFDPDLTRAFESGELVTRMEKRFSPGGPRIIAAAPLENAGRRRGALQAIIPLQDINRSMRHAYSFIFLYILMSAGVLILVGFLLFSRYLVTPVQRLLRQTETIAEENLPDMPPLFLSRGTELQKLSSALKSLAENLKLERGRQQQQMQALEEKNLQLKKAQREIIQSEKLASIGRLAAGIAHEVGNPLGIILGYIHMLRSEELSWPERRQYLDRLEHETERIRTTIGDLLDFARPSSQDIVELDLEAIVREVCVMISHHKEFRGIQIKQEFGPRTPRLRGNGRLVRQMLLNLVLNACDAMQPDGGTLRIQTSLDTAAGADTIRIVVADTGRGIAPEQQEKIFDPFFTTKENGTGLGLANVHRIVELMAGSISLESTPGRGTAFTILLPAAAMNQEA